MGALRFTADGMVRRRLLLQIARAVAAGPRGVAVVIETDLSGASTQVASRDPALLAALRSLAIGSGVAVEISNPSPAPLPPSARVPASIGIVQRTHGGASRRTDRGPKRSPDSPAVSVSPSPSASPSAEVGPIRSAPLPWAAAQIHWISLGDGTLLVPTRWLVAGSDEERASGQLRLAGAIAESAESAGGGGLSLRWRPFRWGVRRRWATGRLRRHESRNAVVAPPDVAVRLVEPLPTGGAAEDPRLDRHLVVIGATGSGKTTAVAGIVARWIASGRPALILDLHGDLTPRVLDELASGPRTTIVALDPTRTGPHGPGVAILGDEVGPREAARVVAAMKRISGDGGEARWGFRLERIFDTLSRVAAEEGGTLLDLYDLLTDPARRDASRLATRIPAAARFLDELPAILRRNPEFLWPAASRLARIALSDELSALLAPSPETSVPAADLLRRGRSIAVRLPLGELGPEAAGVVATLLLSRIYLDLARRADAGAGPVLVVLEEAHGLAAPLVAEILADSRKFGISAIVSTQYPERLAPELRHAAEGAASGHLVFRIPGPAARTVADWTRLSSTDAMRTLPELPDGWGMLTTGGSGSTPRLFRTPVGPPRDGLDVWSTIVESSRREFAGGRTDGGSLVRDADDEELLLALVGRTDPLPLPELLAPRHVGTVGDRERRLERVLALERRSLLVRAADGVSLTAAGARWLGATAEHGSTIESDEHRLLLLEAFRIFATHGERIELLRQGRFDVRLPDARLVLLPPGIGTEVPAALGDAIDRRRTSWAWRYFSGRDVHLEAEVSGAERPERIRRDWEKALRTGTHLLVLVGSPARARRVRRVLANVATARGRWSVWTLRRATGHHVLPTGAG